MGELSITCHYPSPERKLLQEGRYCPQFILLLTRCLLPYHYPRLMGVGSHQVDAGQLPSMDATQPLAIYSQSFSWHQPVFLKPAPQDTLPGMSIQALKQIMQCGGAGGLRAGEAQRRSHLLALLSPPLGNGLQTPCPTQHGTHRQRQDRPQWVSAASGWGSGTPANASTRESRSPFTNLCSVSIPVLLPLFRWNRV